MRYCSQIGSDPLIATLDAGGANAASAGAVDNMLTFDDLLKELEQTGIRERDLVMVHSSYKSLGGVEGGALTVVQARAYQADREWRQRIAERPRMGIDELRARAVVQTWQPRDGYYEGPRRGAGA